MRFVQSSNVAGGAVCKSKNGHRRFRIATNGSRQPQKIPNTAWIPSPQRLESTGAKFLSVVSSSASGALALITTIATLSGIWCLGFDHKRGWGVKDLFSGHLSRIMPACRQDGSEVQSLNVLRVARSCYLGCLRCSFRSDVSAPKFMIPEHHPMPPLDYLREVLSYNRSTGIFRWRTRRASVTKGKVAGHVNPRGYRVISVLSISYRANRLAYYYVTGIDPGDMFIDQENNVPDDNRFKNLRMATESQNSMNRSKAASKSGHTGVRQNKSGTWQAVSNEKGNRHALGSFSTKEEAIAVAENERKRLHRKFYRNHLLDVA